MIEILASLLILASVWLAARQSIWNWPVGILGVCGFGWVFWQARLYAAAGLQVVFLVQSAWGWWTWSRPDRTVRRATEPLFWHLGYRGLIVGFGIWSALTWTASPSPAMDALTCTLSLIATYLLTYRYLETWAVWGVTNVLYAGLFLSQELYATAALSLTLIGLNRIAYLSWSRPQASS